MHDLCVQRVQGGSPEGAVTVEQGVGIATHTHTLSHALTLPPFPSPAFTLGAKHCKVSGWTKSATLFERLLHATAPLNHSHPTQPSPTDQCHTHTHPPTVIHHPSHASSSTHASTGHKPQADLKCHTPTHCHIPYHRRPPALIQPLPVAPRANQAIHTDIIHHTRDLTFARAPHSYP